MSEEKPPEPPSAPQQLYGKNSGPMWGCLVAIVLSPFYYLGMLVLAFQGHSELIRFLILLPPLGGVIWLGWKVLYRPPKEDATPTPEDESEQAEQ